MQALPVNKKIFIHIHMKYTQRKLINMALENQILLLLLLLLLLSTLDGIGYSHRNV